MIFPTLAQIILNLLNDDDHMMLMAISDTVHTIDSSNRFLSMNSTSKNQLRKFVDSLEKEAAPTNHSLAFKYAFEWITSQIESGAISSEGKLTPLQILYVSRGAVSQLAETKSVLDAIATGQSHFKQPVVINTCAIMLDESNFQAKINAI